MQGSSGHGGPGTPGKEGGWDRRREWKVPPRITGGRVIGIWVSWGRELDICQVRAEWQVYTWMEGAVTGSEGSRAMLCNVGVLPPC